MQDADPQELLWKYLNTVASLLPDARVGAGRLGGSGVPSGRRQLAFTMAPSATPYLLSQWHALALRLRLDIGLGADGDTAKPETLLRWHLLACMQVAEYLHAI